MIWLAAGLASLLLLAVVAYFVPILLCSNLQLRAEPSGAWAIAVGLGVGPLAFSAIAAAGVTPFLTCHLFGRQLLRLPISRFTAHRKCKATADAEPAAPRLSRAAHSIASFVQALDPVETLLAWWDRERCFEVRSLVVDLDYSFRDVALTGRILAALYVLSAVLPEHWQVNQSPRWESEDRVLLVADGRFRIWLGRLAFDLVGFVLKQRSSMRQRAEPAASE